ncbi:uncharacterized protein [Cardiocondyla obscurior]|uniref:uncharacterized protein n=1 Tax=Cardiocondyla obscurior TaxID=286306 RepID=UPI0039656165
MPKNLQDPEGGGGFSDGSVLAQVSPAPSLSLPISDPSSSQSDITLKSFSAFCDKYKDIMEIQEFENPSKATSANSVEVANSSLMNGTKVTKTASSDSSKKRSFEHSYNSSNSSKCTDISAKRIAQSNSDNVPVFRNSSATKKIPLKYSNKDFPPYSLMVVSATNENTVANSNNSLIKNKNLHPLLVSRSITKITSVDFVECKKVGFGKVMIECRDFNSANKIIDNPDLLNHGLKAFIPSFKLVRSGIIRDIPQELTPQDIIEMIESKCKIIFGRVDNFVIITLYFTNTGIYIYCLKRIYFNTKYEGIEVHRLNRRTNTSEGTLFVPSRSICVKFLGQTLPQHIAICKIRHEVHPYVPKTKICYSCFRVGHVSKACKSKPRCLHCGNLSHPEGEHCTSINNPPNCINCGNSHLATSRDCSVIIRNKQIQSLAAVENIPIFLAREKVNKINNNQGISSDPRSDVANFPFLNSNPSSQCIPSFSSFNRFSSLNALPFSLDPVSLTQSRPSYANAIISSKNPKTSKFSNYYNKTKHSSSSSTNSFNTNPRVNSVRTGLSSLSFQNKNFVTPWYGAGVGPFAGTCATS